MNEDITKKALGEGLEQDRTDWERLERMGEDDIDCSDIPEVDESVFQRARVSMPPGKTQVTIRLDTDVLDWLKTQGRGYQTRINAILRAYYDAQRGDGGGRAG